MPSPWAYHRRVPPTADYCSLLTVVAGGVYLPPVTPAHVLCIVIPFTILYFCLCMPGRREPGSEPIGVVWERG